MVTEVAAPAERGGGQAEVRRGQVGGQGEEREVSIMGPVEVGERQGRKYNWQLWPGRNTPSCSGYLTVTTCCHHSLQVLMPP
jgi:hypothetical protein